MRRPFSLLLSSLLALGALLFAPQASLPVASRG